MTFLGPILENLVFLIVILPVVGAVLVWSGARLGKEAVQRTAMTNVTISVTLSWLLVFSYEIPSKEPSNCTPLIQMETQLPWLSPLTKNRQSQAESNEPFGTEEIRFAVGVDGVSLWFVLLTTTLTFLAVFASINRRIESSSSYYALLLLCEAVSLLVFVALDVLFLAMALIAVAIPVVLLVGQWGTRGRRDVIRRHLVQASAAGLLVLMGLVLSVVAESWLRSNASQRYPAAKHSMQELTRGVWSEVFVRENESSVVLWREVSPWGALLTGFGLALLLPIPPFHLSHISLLECAPAATRGFFGVVGTSLGFYGCLRALLPLFPQDIFRFAPLVAIALFAGIIWCWLIALGKLPTNRRVSYLFVGAALLAVMGMAALNSKAAMGGVLLLSTAGIGMAAFLLLSASNDEISVQNVAATYRMVPRFLAKVLYVFVLAATCLAVWSSLILLAFGLFESYLIVSLGIVPALLAMLVPASYAVMQLLYGVNWRERVGHLTVANAVAILPLGAMLMLFGCCPQFVLSRMAPSLRAMFLLYAGQ